MRREAMAGRPKGARNKHQYSRSATLCEWELPMPAKSTGGCARLRRNWPTKPPRATLPPSGKSPTASTASRSGREGPGGAAKINLFYCHAVENADKPVLKLALFRAPAKAHFFYSHVIEI